MNYLSDGHFWNLHKILHQTHIYVFPVRQIQKKLFSFEHLPFFLFFWFFAKITIFRSRAPVFVFTVDQILSHFEKIEFFVIFTCGTSQYRPRRIFCGYRNFYITLEIGLVTSKVFPIQKGGVMSSKFWR